MNNDDLPSDDVLQFVFGELDDVRKAAVRKAVAEDAELAATVRQLTAAVAAVHAENAAQVSDDFNDRLRQRMLEVLEPELAETTRPKVRARSRTTWTWIMRSPVSGVATVAALVFVIIGVALWFHGIGATPAFADFIRPILEAKTVKYKSTAELAGKRVGGVDEWSVDIASNRSRGELQGEKMYHPLDRSVIITDGSDGRTETTLMYWPAAKLATTGTIDGIPAKHNWFQEVRSVLLDARDKPGVKVEPLGEKTIDGRHTVGFRVTHPLTSPGMVVSIWGDPQTGLPIRIETTDRLEPGAKSISSDFVFNVELDESLFNMEPPAGYKVKHLQFKFAVGNEKDIVEALRFFSEVSGGAFPNDFGAQAHELLRNSGIVLKPGKSVDAEVRAWMKTQHWPNAQTLTDEQKQKVDAFREQAVSDHTFQCTRALRFVIGLPREADVHYAGKGVKFGAADMPIFWYRPTSGKKYRVIYADLLVHDADAPPNVPDAQSASGAGGSKK